MNLIIKFHKESKFHILINQISIVQLIQLNFLTVIIRRILSLLRKKSRIKYWWVKFIIIIIKL